MSMPHEEHTTANEPALAASSSRTPDPLEDFLIRYQHYQNFKDALRAARQSGTEHEMWRQALARFSAAAGEGRTALPDPLALFELGALFEAEGGDRDDASPQGLGRAALLDRARAVRARQKAHEGTDLDPVVRARRAADKLRGLPA
jgi:hypothetical protein